MFQVKPVNCRVLVVHYVYIISWSFNSVRFFLLYSLQSLVPEVNKSSTVVITTLLFLCKEEVGTIYKILAVVQVRPDTGHSASCILILLYRKC